MAKISNFASFGPDKREIWQGDALPCAKFHVYLGNVSPLRDEKPVFGPLSEKNTGIAALRAGLPVIIIITRGQSNLTKSASAHSPVRGHPRGSNVVPLNFWSRVSY